MVRADFLPFTSKIVEHSRYLPPIMENGFPATLCPFFALVARNRHYGRGYMLAT